MTAGAPKGNTNALKHGLYAKHFNEAQRGGLKRMAWEDFRHEEFAHRVIGAKIFKLLNDLLSGQQPDIERVARLVYSLSINTTSTCTSARTHANLNGKDAQLGDALTEAPGNVPFDEPDDGT